MPTHTATNVIDILLGQRVIDNNKLEEARKESITTQKSLEDVLVSRGWISSLDIIKAKSVMYGVPYIDIANTTVPPKLINLISEDDALRSNLLIFEESNGLYKAAMSNPLDIQTIRDFERKLNGRIQVYIAPEKELTSKIRSVYTSKIGAEVNSAVEEAVSSSEIVDISRETGGSIDSLDVSNAPVAKIVNMLLESAVQTKASDVHIEPQVDRIRVRFRVHGILKETLSLPLAVGPSLVSRIKILSRMPIDEKRKPLDGRFQIKSGEQEVDLRVSSLPTVLGEKVVIRLLRKDLGILSLEDTGMRGIALKTFMEGLKATSGIILVTGPTGSGKTVTVATSMHILNKPEVNVVSIEDPVEIKIPGVNQVQVNVDAGLSFAAALRSFLRQDPNVISVGEIRDEETAQLAAQASLTGHLVISTLHTNSAAGVLPRLLDMGVEPYIIASTVHICSAQRLCRRICKDCVYAYEADGAQIDEIRKTLNSIRQFNLEKFAQQQANLIQKNNFRVQSNPSVSNGSNQNNQPSPDSNQVADQSIPKLYLFKGAGCEKCGGSGYSGRVGIFEVFRVTEKVGRLVMNHATADEIENEAMNDGMIRMIQDGYFKALDGLTTIDEVLRVIHG